jgi:hypothetical protein
MLARFALKQFHPQDKFSREYPKHYHIRETKSFIKEIVDRTPSFMLYSKFYKIRHPIVFVLLAVTWQTPFIVQLEKGLKKDNF